MGRLITNLCLIKQAAILISFLAKACFLSFSQCVN